MDMSRFDVATLLAFTATKETNYGTWKGNPPILMGFSGFVATKPQQSHSSFKISSVTLRENSTLEHH